MALAVGAPLSGCGRTAATRNGPAPPAQTRTLFHDVSAAAGIGGFTLGHGGRSPLTILETLGNGCAFLDYDGDGWMDILLVGPNKVCLYHNDHNGAFTDVTASSGLRQQGYWQGVAVGDYDNDGRPDIFITGYRCCALYHNEGLGSQQNPGTPQLPTGPLYREVTERSGVASKLWGASAAFLDVDNDGRLDLFVTHYVKFYPTSVQYCWQTGVRSACGPTNYDPEKPTLYHNNGNGIFTDETALRGLSSAHGNALGVAAADYDGDGWVDIAVANDQLPGDLFHNKGRGYYENVGLMSGTAYDVQGNAHAGMGADWADVRDSGKLDLVVTTYQHQPKSVYTQGRPGSFTDDSYTLGIGQATVNYVGFGVKFFDYDNDGWPDLVIANGHAVDNIARTDRTSSYPQITQVFHNSGGKLQEVTTQAGPDFTHPIVGRGLAVGDYDNDGRQDLLVVDLEGHPLLLHNDAPAGHWLALKLIGSRGNRDGYGARIFVEAGGKRWVQSAGTDGSYMSASDPRIHLGLGAATHADKITIHWLGGHVTEMKNVAGDRVVAVEESGG